MRVILFLLILFYSTILSAASIPSNNVEADDGTFDGSITVSGSCTCDEGVTLGGTNSRVTFDNDEYIDGGTDDLILFQGVGGDATNIILDLDGTAPTFSSTDNNTVFLSSVSIAPKATNIVGFSMDNAAAGYTSVNNTTGLNLNVAHSPVDSKTGNAYGIFGNNLIQGANFDVGSVAKALYFSNAGLTLSGGSANLDVFGVDIAGYETFSGADLLAKDIYGARVISTQWQTGAGSSINAAGNIYTLDLNATPNDSRVTVDGNEIILNVAQPVSAEVTGNQYQVVLEGNGAKSGIWFDSAERIYSDGTNIVNAAPVQIYGANNNCTLTVDDDATCDSGTKVAEDTSIALCMVCASN